MSRLDFARIVRNLRLKTREYNRGGSALALAEMRNCEAQVDAALAEEFAPPTTGLVCRPPVEVPAPIPATDENLDAVLVRWDQTDVAMQRKIVFALAQKLALATGKLSEK